jgi:hypothetical protein
MLSSYKILVYFDDVTHIWMQVRVEISMPLVW